MSTNGASPHIHEPEYFSLRTQDGQVLLPGDQALVITPLHEMALLVDWRERRLIAACTFFDEELTLLLPILRAWPTCARYSHLLCLLQSNQPTGSALAEQEQRIAQAREMGEMDTLLAPLRRKISDMQKKLKIFGLSLVVIMDIGIVLFPRQRISAT